MGKQSGDYTGRGGPCHGALYGGMAWRNLILNAHFKYGGFLLDLKITPCIFVQGRGDEVN